MKFELFEILRYIDTHTKKKKEFYDLLPQMTPSDLFRLYLRLCQEENSTQKCQSAF